MASGTAESPPSENASQWHQSGALLMPRQFRLRSLFILTTNRRAGHACIQSASSSPTWNKRSDRRGCPPTARLTRWPLGFANNV